ncbi:MAG: hypothetical protein ACKVH0_10550, partial [Alphaproteobacteria bacterium]
FQCKALLLSISKAIVDLVTPPSAWFSTELIVDTGTPRAAMPIPEVPKLIKPKVYQKTYHSELVFYKYAE